MLIRFGDTAVEVAPDAVTKSVFASEYFSWLVCAGYRCTCVLGSAGIVHEHSGLHGFSWTSPCGSMLVLTTVSVAVPVPYSVVSSLWV